MRYLDSGSRDPQTALATWLKRELTDPSVVTALRAQSGFFGASSLSLFADTFAHLDGHGGEVAILVGSNDGTTARASVGELLRLTGAKRPGRRIGVVSYDRGYFHPKTVHITRSDRSSCAYVGSANLTGSGVAALHVEAGLVLDSRDGDDTAVLADISDAVDGWFAERRPGLFVVEEDADLDDLVSRLILDVPKPPSPRAAQVAKAPSRGQTAGAKLLPLVALPSPPPTPAPAAAPPVRGTARAVAGRVAAATTPTTWHKKLTQSDAQRKPTGNQRGSITLTGRDAKVDTQNYFRFGLFADATWAVESTRTGKDLQVAIVPFSVRIGAVDRGVVPLIVSYAPNREQDQRNYTSLLHLGPLTEDFAASDMTGRVLRIDRSADETFQLTIT